MRRIYSLTVTAAAVGHVLLFSAAGGAIAQAAEPGAGWDRARTRQAADEEEENRFSAALRKAADALTPDPEYIEAKDPISLSNMPEKLDHSVYLHAARLSESQGNVEGAARHYQKAMQAAPNDLAVLIGYARLQDRRDQYAAAEQLYRRAVNAHPRSALAHNDLGLCQARHGDPRAAAAALERAVALAPKNKRYRNNLATVLIEADRIDDALRHLKAVHQPATAHYNLGYLLYKRGDQQPARTHLAKAVELDRALTPARTLLSRLGGEPAARTAMQPPRRMGGGPIPAERANSQSPPGYSDPPPGAPRLQDRRSRSSLYRIPPVEGSAAGAPADPPPQFRSRSPRQANAPALRQPLGF